jgi:hypothetical protein
MSAADLQLIGPLTLATGVTSRIIKLDPARNEDICATVTAGNLPAAATVTIQLIMAGSLSMNGVNEDPATVFGVADRVASTVFSAPAAAIWSLNAVLPGRYTHMRIINGSANTQTFMAIV